MNGRCAVFGSARCSPPSCCPASATLPARRPVSVAEPPWSALVRVQVPGVSRCTGFLVAADRVVTAAHCLWGQRTQRMVPAESVHVLTGYDHGHYRAHSVVASFRTGPAYRPRAGAGQDDDVAVLTLAKPIGTVVLPWATHIQPGEAAMLGGYEQDRAETLLADTDCRLMSGTDGGGGGRPLIAHACAATRGTSGAPLLVRGADGGWAVAGVNVAAAIGDVGGLAVPASTVRAMLGAAGG